MNACHQRMVNFNSGFLSQNWEIRSQMEKHIFIYTHILKFRMQIVWSLCCANNYLEKYHLLDFIVQNVFGT